jgi:hypothetical protein
VKILSFGVTQQFDDVTNWILDLMIGVRLPPLEDDSYIDHVACSGYVELQVLWGSGATRFGGVVRYFFKSLKASFAS